MVFVFDLVINFFLLPVNEAGQVIFIPREEVFKRYFYGRFAFDLLMLLPYGIVMIYDPALGCFWILKTLRIRDMIHFINNQHIFNTVLNAFVIYRQ